MTFIHVFKKFAWGALKHPGGHNLAGGQHHCTIRVILVKLCNPYWSPTINVDKLWSLISEEEKAWLTSESKVVPVIDILAHRYGKLLGKELHAREVVLEWMWDAALPCCMLPERHYCCDFCQKAVYLGGGGMVNHIRKSPGCFVKFQEFTAADVQATLDKSDNPSTSQEEGDLLIQAGSSSSMEVDPELYSPFGPPATDLAQAVDDPPPDSDNELNMESVASDMLLEDEESDWEDGIGSEDPFTFPLGVIDTEERGFSYEHFQMQGLHVMPSH
ncbi:uncharacterized protein EI90DRAFT_3013382 [Cantharellus anzutake]|uniref:uncharacterized protein n=1 Tax=Cantharellus anzutake TaxID=1750568 RepID=UPI001906CD20|nr:uncharacterized protein EI90DRAFT_3013382 [Cantharellus anzutake]KAF8338058.1 hypothetical protein EI90DRAFT_3013382 [Cantharellus anzutake]